MQEKKLIKKYIVSAREEIIEFQRLLTSIPAISPDSGGKGELAKAKALENWLESKKMGKVNWYNAEDTRAEGGIRPNMVLEIPGKKHDRAFWIMSHIDIVPPGELSLWSNDPYQLKVETNKIYGRGVEDNQQGLTASVFAALSLMENNIVPEYDVKLLFVADEEMGSEYGIKFLIEKHDLFKKEDFVLVPDSGDKSGTLIEIAEKNILWLKITTLGKQCHASRPNLGRNAFAASAELIHALAEFEKSIGDHDPIFNPPGTTITPTKKEANVPNINTIPGEDVFYLDCRILPKTGADKILSGIKKVIKKIEKKYKVEIKYEIVQKVSSLSTSKKSLIVSLLKKAIKEVYGKKSKVIGIGGGTVASFLRNKGIDAVVWSRINETAHMPNEYCKLDHLEGDAVIMAYLMAGCL
ncbi:MAG: M20 family metallo-hydrolase [Spirochaetaceae bacterium]|nr:M20 family metallo-hydrolase [Spirochaetaceae bacterium]